MHTFKIRKSFYTEIKNQLKLLNYVLNAIYIPRRQNSLCEQFLKWKLHFLVQETRFLSFTNVKIR